MRISNRVAAVLLLSFTAVLTITAEIASAAAFSDTPSFGAREVEFFAAINAEKITATMVPNDSRRVTLQVKNNTDQPLAVRLPKAFAGVPVLAQFAAPGGGGGGIGMVQPQGLGMGFPGGGGGGNPFGGPGGVMNIPPGKIIKVKRKSVCLEYGKPEPGPRIAYEIVPLATVSKDASLREILTILAYDELDQRIAQIIAWRFANDMTWEQLAGLTVKHFNGRRTPRFTAAEIRTAQRLVTFLPSQHESKDSRNGPNSLSRR